MKYSQEQLAAMARTVLDHRPVYYSPSLKLDSLRSHQVISALQSRFGCSETYVLNQLVRMADPKFNQSYTSNRAA